MAGLRTFEGRAMASPLRLTLSRRVPDAAADLAWGELRDEFEAAERAMSRFRDSSEVTALNRAGAAGRGMAVGPRLRRALVAADRARRLTGGAFDPRVLRDLDRLGYQGAAVDGQEAAEPGRASAAEPARASAASLARAVERCADGTMRVGTPIDLGGIGKGLALRWAAARVRRALPRGSGALIEAGGDLVSVGDPPEGPWRIGLEDPAGGSEPAAVLEVPAGAIATSSVLVNRWVGPDGGVVHHLLDPRDGEPADGGIAAVTVATADPAWAEVRTKQLFLAGRPSIGPLARSLGLAAWWVTSEGAVEMTPGARAQTIWLRAEGMVTR